MKTIRARPTLLHTVRLAAGLLALPVAACAAPPAPSAPGASNGPPPAAVMNSVQEVLERLHQYDLQRLRLQLDMDRLKAEREKLQAERGELTAERARLEKDRAAIAGKLEAMPAPDSTAAPAGLYLALVPALLATDGADTQVLEPLAIVESLGPAGPRRLRVRHAGREYTADASSFGSEREVLSQLAGREQLLAAELDVAKRAPAAPAAATNESVETLEAQLDRTRTALRRVRQALDDFRKPPAPAPSPGAAAAPAAPPQK